MLLNIIGFNISWFGLVLIGKPFIPVVFLWLGLHLCFCKTPLAEFKLIILITFIGTLVDSTLLYFDVLVFNDDLIIPFWFIMLWAAFAATIAHSLNFLAQSQLLQFCIGYLFPPLSYFAGVSLTSIEFGYNPIISYFIIAPIWGGLLVLFFHLKTKFYEKDTLLERCNP